MTKTELALIYQRLCNRKLTIKQARKELEDFLLAMEKALKQDKKIKFTRVGVMEVIDLKPRRIADPNTKEPMIIYPKKDVRFKSSVRKSLVED